MTDAISPFSGKQARTIEHSLRQLAGRKSYKAIRSIDDFGDDSFHRLLQLSNHRMVLLTDHGMEQVEQIVNLTVKANPFASLADYARAIASKFK